MNQSIKCINKSSGLLSLPAALITMTLCFSTDTFARNSTLVYSSSAVGVKDHLESDPDATLFLTAFKASSLWKTFGQSAPVTLLVPTDAALHQEGSAFLLEIVLPKPENSKRLDDLINTHLATIRVDLQDKAFSSASITVRSGFCFNLLKTATAIKVGPEAIISKQIDATDGTLYYIDRLLWVPYKGDGKCL